MLTQIFFFLSSHLRFIGMEWEVSVWLVCRTLIGLITDESKFLKEFVCDSFKGNSNCSKPFLISGAKRDPCSLTSFL